MALWMIRAGRQGQNEQFALENGMAAIGWEELPSIARVRTREELRELYEETYPRESKNAVSNHVGQLWAFKARIEIGDFVALPMKTRGSVALGKIAGNYEYLPENPYGAKHTRKVEWIRKDVPRSEFGQDLLYSLGAFMTICRIKRNNAEERVERIIDGNPDPRLRSSQEELTTLLGAEDEQEEPWPDLEEFAKDQIRGYIEARFKGHGLADLVKAVLEAQGYSTYISNPGPDGGIDILAGKGTLGFDPPRLCIQVKSGSSPADVSAIRELEGVMSRANADQGLFVSWSGFRDMVYRETRNTYFRVRLWDADDLVEVILEQYGNLPEEIQAELPLKRIWVIVPEE